jgi:tRNA-dihydrouridine synthase
MGCPDRAVEKSGAGAALIKDPERAAKIIRETKAGAGDMPVSVKTRIGYNKNELDTWLPALLGEGPAAVTLHLRTRKEMSDVDAHWDAATQALAIRDRLDSSASKPLILGNGDVYTLSGAEEKVRAYGVDGVMFGRGIFGQPWLFSGKPEPELDEKLRIMVEHTELFEELFKDTKSFNVMKKHYKAYVTGFRGANELRARLMEAKDAAEVREVAEKFILSA